MKTANFLLLPCLFAISWAQELRSLTFQKAGGAPRPPVQCDPGEVRCELGFCFDRTCGNRNFPSLKSGQCRCANGLRRDQSRRCVDNNGCLGRAAEVNAEPRPINAEPINNNPPPPQNEPDISIAKPNRTPPPPVRRKRLQDLNKFPLLWSLYSTEQQDHFYTTDASELTNANNNFNYVTEEAIGRLAPNAGVIEGPCPSLRPLVRLYEANWAKNHFYTTDPSQVESAAKGGYVVEGPVGNCVIFTPDCGADLPLHRFWSESLGDHIYITKLKDFETLRADSTWAYEGVECYVWRTAYPDAVVEEERQYFLNEAAREAREQLRNRAGEFLGPERQPGETELQYRARIELERELTERAAQDAQRAAIEEAQRLGDPFAGETARERAARLAAAEAARRANEEAGNTAAREAAARAAAEEDAARRAAAAAFAGRK